MECWSSVSGMLVWCCWNVAGVLVERWCSIGGMLVEC